MSYASSAATRQAILDHLHTNPMRSANQLSIEIGATRNAVQACVKFMAERGELDKLGSGKKVGYRANVTTTISAEQVIGEMQAKRQAAGFKTQETESGKISRPGYYSQRGGNWAPKSGSGQGNLRRVVGIQASAGML